jgi:hypothetical protein
MRQKFFFEAIIANFAQWVVCRWLCRGMPKRIRAWIKAKAHKAFIV